jgi:peptidoglycan LD-endopeptidase LytH
VTRPIGDVRRRWLAALLGVAVATGTVGTPAHAPSANAQEPPSPPPAAVAEDEGPPAPTPEELAHEVALAELTAALRERRAAQLAVRGATTGTARADGALRVGEEGVVDVLLEQLSAEETVVETHQQVRAAQRRVGRLERRLAGLQQRAVVLGDEIEWARLQLEERIVRAYKTGSLGYETTLPLTLVREATSPSELATAVKHLATLMAVGLEDVERLVDELAANAAATRSVGADLDRSRDELDAAREEAVAAEQARERSLVAVDQREARVAALRADAYGAEARLLAAVSAVARAQGSLTEAREQALRTAERAELPPPELDGVAPDDEDDLVATAWDKRESALTRARSLAPADRRSDPGWVCPVEGSRFINDWGFPRSSNRRHEGTDVFAPTGTPVRAPVAATVADLDPYDRYDGRRDLGGITVSLEAGHHRYYLAHLDAIHPDLREGDEVAAGDVVGWVGRTGNARGTPPHLHLGWYVDRVAVNAYPSLAVACSGDRPPNGISSGGTADEGELAPS